MEPFESCAVLVAFFLGSYDPNSPLRALQGQQHLLEIIWRHWIVDQEHEADLWPNPGYLINLMPATLSLSQRCVSDGAVIVADLSTGFSAKTEQMLRDCMIALIKPTLILNELESFIGVHLAGSQAQLLEDTYIVCSSIVDQVNDVISEMIDDTAVDWQVSPLKGTVLFSSGRDGWSFSLHQFGRMYARRFNSNSAMVIERLWGMPLHVCNVHPKAVGYAVLYVYLLWDICPLLCITCVQECLASSPRSPTVT